MTGCIRGRDMRTRSTGSSCELDSDWTLIAAVNVKTMI
jgi:hypothetical protein